MPTGVYNHKPNQGFQCGNKLGVSNKGKIRSNGYSAIHKWVVKIFGKATECEKCGNTNRVEWSNKYHNYLRERVEWQQLCSSCHLKYDNQENEKSKYKKICVVCNKKFVANMHNQIYCTLQCKENREGRREYKTKWELKKYHSTKQLI